ncbi:MAG: EF2563 family selenium-dependent molybdenum hydroxylase system protein [Deltaproteobacteria bacterium]|nr:MAG: molybdenum hydroxylase [Desulfobacteraceae bacterium 4484_190.3]RLB17942.1 MAG: EF2563 family selenium-dependent molybdenum hydroxylase system protein [Deltaproteobacteria bacterium]
MESLSDMAVIVKGGGDLATGVAWRLHHCGFKVLITETETPLAVRRKVSFCEAVYDGATEVEGVGASLIRSPGAAEAIWKENRIPVIVDPSCECRIDLEPAVLVDATLAKKNLGTSINDAPLVIALGPGFEAGVDAHFVVETNRGHRLGRLIMEGTAEPNTGVPGSVLGHTSDRVLRAPADGIWRNRLDIGDTVRKGDLVGDVEESPVTSAIDGIIRGLIHPGIPVSKGLKIGDIDPRPQPENCFTISEKALAIAGGVLEGILRVYGGSRETEHWK